jgi:hypothetical protein
VRSTTFPESLSSSSSEPLPSSPLKLYSLVEFLLASEARMMTLVVSYLLAPGPIPPPVMSRFIFGEQQAHFQNIYSLEIWFSRFECFKGF